MTATALQLPGLESSWQLRRRNDDAAIALADRHYSRRTLGAWVGPPGRVLVFVTGDERALWVSHYPKPEYALDGVDAFRCSAFRNEGVELSSTLIRSAMATTLEVWRDVRPAGGWLTYVDTERIAPTTNPGYCFRVAGWNRDPTYRPRARARTLIRLRAPL